MGWRSDTKTLGNWLEYINKLQRKQSRPMTHEECVLVFNSFRAKHSYIMDKHDPKGLITMREILFGNLIPKFKYDETGELRLYLERPKSKFRGVLQTIEKHKNDPEKLVRLLQKEELSLIRFIELMECIRFRKEYRRMEKQVNDNYMQRVKGCIYRAVEHYLEEGSTNFALSNEVIKFEIEKKPFLLAPITEFPKAVRKSVISWLKERKGCKGVTSHIEILTVIEGDELAVVLKPKDKAGDRIIRDIRLGV